MLIANLVGTGLFLLSVITGFAVLGNCTYLINSLLSPVLAWILLGSAWVGGLLLRIISDPKSAVFTLQVSGNSLLILALLSGISLLLATLGFLDVRDVLSLWGLFGGGIISGIVSLLLARHETWTHFSSFIGSESAERKM